MNAPVPLGAWVPPAERPMLIAAAEQLSEALTDPGEAGWPVALHFTDGREAPPPLLVATMTDLVGADGAAVKARGERLAALAGQAEAVFLCTLPRHVADPARRRALMPQIRALNLAAIRWSHAYGLAVVDLDRLFALFGLRPLESDYRIGGPVAAEVAAHGIVAALLAHGLDAYVPVDRQERATARHGDLHGIAAKVARRLDTGRGGQA